MRKTFTLPRSHVAITVTAPWRGLASLAAVIAGIVAAGVKFGATGASIVITVVIGYLALWLVLLVDARQRSPCLVLRDREVTARDREVNET